MTRKYDWAVLDYSDLKGISLQVIGFSKYYDHRICTIKNSKKYDLSQEKERVFWKLRTKAIAESLNSWERDRLASIKLMISLRSYLSHFVRYGFLSQIPFIDNFYFNFGSDTEVFTDIRNFLHTLHDIQKNSDTPTDDEYEETNRMTAQLCVFVLDDLIEFWS